MGPEQVAIALVLPDVERHSRSSIRKHFEFFAGLLSKALSEFGIQASFVGKNDLQVQGRKIAGLAISQDIKGIVFYHGSLLLDFDVEAMVTVLNLPTQTLDDRGQSCFSRRMTTVRDHAENVSFKDAKKAIRNAIEETSGAAVAPATWGDRELQEIERLQRERYQKEDWIYSSRVVRRWNGTAQRKTPGGMLRVYVSRNGPTLDAVLITGDYFSRSIELAELESSLKGVPAKYGSVADVISGRQGETIYRVSKDQLAEIIIEASVVE